jgi:hypothetical protein
MDIQDSTDAGLKYQEESGISVNCFELGEQMESH